MRIQLPKGSYRPIFDFRESLPDARAAAPPSKPWALIGVSAAIVVGAAILTGVLWRTRPSVPASIAVLPFLNLTGDPANDYLSDGISEELTEALAEFDDLRVVARTSAFQYKGKSTDVREIGKNLRVGAVLEGSVAERDGKVHVVAQLIRTSDGYHLWSHIYDAVSGGIPGLEAGIARETRVRLSPAPPHQRPGTEQAARNPEAHDLYIRAVYEFNRRTGPSTRQAVDLARQAAAKDPSFAQPYVLMAAGESQLNTLNLEAPAEGSKRAWEDVAKALDLDPLNSAAHAQKALLAYTDHWDWPQAEREFRLALATGHHGSAENLYGWCLMTRGRFEEAQSHLQAAAELDPLSLGPQLNQVENLIAQRRDSEAKNKVDQILNTAPSNPVVLALVLEIAVAQKDCARARASSGSLLNDYPRVPVVRIGVLAADAACGTPGNAQTVLDSIARERLPGYVSPYSVAAAFAYQGDAGQALVNLSKAADVREPKLLAMKVEHLFDFLEKEPKFTALERKIGLLE